MSAANLRVISADGEILPGCPACADKDDVIAGLERDIRGWAARYAQLRRDLAAEAQDHPLYEQAQDVFNYWRAKCRHTRSKWTTDRFWTLEPLLSEYGEGMCRKAIDGAAYDPYTSKRRNGSVKRHDDFDLIFRNAGKVEEFCNRAPRGKT